MNRLLSLLKMNLKLLFRNKGFLFFLLITPIVSVFILNIRTNNSLENKNSGTNKVVELKTLDERLIYKSDYTSYIIKVYDQSNTKQSQYLLQQLSESGIFIVGHYDASAMTEKEIEKQSKKDAFDDRIGAIIYLKKNFANTVANGQYKEGIQIYNVSDDERIKLLKEELSGLLNTIHNVEVEKLQLLEKTMPQKKVVAVNGADKIKLTQRQIDAKGVIGYALAIITLGFLFCGVCISYSIIEERNNKVYTRLMLTKVTRYEYLCSKLMVCVIVALVQTVLMGICMMLFSNLDFGMKKVTFLSLIFLIGLIFSLISLVIGVLVGDIMGANYATFAIWSVSGLIAGMYFPLEGTSKVIKLLSNLMPQKWFMKGFEMIMVKESGAVSMLLCITVAYILFTLSVGVVGLKLKREE